MQQYIGSQPHLETLALRARLDSDASYSRGYNDAVAEWAPVLERQKRHTETADANTESWVAHSNAWQARAEAAEAQLAKANEDAKMLAEEACRRLDAWKVYSDKLKASNEEWKTRHDELQQLNAELKEGLAATRAELAAQQTVGAEQAQLQQRNLVFIEVLSDVLRQVTSPDYPFGGEIRHVFKSTYKSEIATAISAGRLTTSPERDPVFAKAYPDAQRLVVSILDQARQDSDAMSRMTGYEPDDNLP